MEDVGKGADEDDYERKKANSTSSYYINSTLARPDTDEIVFCVAVVIHDHIVQGEQVPRPPARPTDAPGTPGASPTRRAATSLAATRRAGELGGAEPLPVLQ